MSRKKIMLIPVEEIPYINWGEKRASLFKGLLRERYRKPVTAYQLYKIIGGRIDYSASNLKKLMGDAGKSQTAHTVPLGKIIDICNLVEIDPRILFPIFDLEIPENLSNSLDS